MICIIGIDAATVPKKVGLARGFLKGGSLVIDQVLKPVGGRTLGSIVSDWISLSCKTLIAIDAPLGWPVDLGQALVEHDAGEFVNAQPNDLFRRETDRFVKRVTGKLPLDVGADRIARTAHAALKYLGDVRETSGCAIPLFWDNDFKPQAGVIEVYPAATLKQSGGRSQGYKRKDCNFERSEVLNSIAMETAIEVDRELLIADDDLLDAAVCVLAGAHFINGLCYEPEILGLAKKEGWIWVRQPAN